MNGHLHHPLSLYLDSSVLGGYFDPVFEADTQKLWRQRETGQFRFFTSDVVSQEMIEAPARVRALQVASIPQEDVVQMTDAMEALAEAYVIAKVLPPKFLDDARHVAICTIAGIGHLVSWNFRHLTNIRREAGFNAINLLQGYPSVRIVAPTFLIHGHTKETL